MLHEQVKASRLQHAGAMTYQTYQRPTLALSAVQPHHCRQPLSHSSHLADCPKPADPMLSLWDPLALGLSRLLQSVLGHY